MLIKTNKNIMALIGAFIGSLFIATTIQAQPPGFPGAPAAAPVEIPDPIVAAIPSVKPITGSGKVYNSSAAQWPGYDVEHFDYEINEYMISGVAAGEAYTTRLVIRQPSDDSKFTGMVIAEAMHPAGAAHAFEYNSVYIMDAGHITVEVVTQGFEQIAAFNPERYGDLSLNNDQVSEILAQAGALIKSSSSPIADLNLRKMVLWGTSASSRILTNYLPSHQVFKLSNMENIYDGFMPTMNGTTIQPVDVPMIQVPTQHEYQGVATVVQDGDEAGSQFRVYEFVAMAHLDSRHTRARFTQKDCQMPLSNFPIEAYTSVALHHLLQWVDKGIVPPRAERVIMDMYVDNDGSLMQLDEFGNAMGGIRNPYVDVPLSKYTMINPPSSSGSGEGLGMMGTEILCFLSGWETPISQADLASKYGSTANYVREVERSLNAQEAAGWSLPVYHDLIMADARAVNF